MCLNNRFKIRNVWNSRSLEIHI